MPESHWISDTVVAQRIERMHMDNLFVGSVAGASASFYTLYELSLWFKQKGINGDDPVWEYLDQLAVDELIEEATDQ